MPQQENSVPENTHKLPPAIYTVIQKYPYSVLNISELRVLSAQNNTTCEVHKKGVQIYLVLNDQETKQNKLFLLYKYLKIIMVHF